MRLHYNYQTIVKYNFYETILRSQVLSNILNESVGL